MEVNASLSTYGVNPLLLSTELEKPSPYHLGYRCERALVERLKEESFDKIFFITEESLFPIHGKSLFEMLQDSFPDVEKLFIPSGEKSKYFPILEQVCENLIEQGVSKKSILLAFGGGGVGNLVGLAAGLIFRGVRYVEIPTTFTGQTDSTLSNKQAVNGRTGKNQFGLYHAPLFIWADTHYLSSEPASSQRSGIIEGIKNGFISDADFLQELSGLLKPDLSFTPAELFHLAHKIILSKLVILRRDPSEKHYGLILEYGHTFGHAIEWLEKTRLIHGEAVSIGMRIAARLGQTLGLLNAEDVYRHDEMIMDRLGLDLALPPSLTTDSIMSAMLADNKKTGRHLRFVLLERIGQCHNPEGDYLVTVDAKTVRSVLDAFIAQERPVRRRA